LVELIGRDRDGRFEVSVPPTGGVLGRGRRAEIRLGHPSISRRHALLEPLGGGRWRITDLGSRNGVTLRSVRVHSGEVCEGESIGLGDLSVQLRGDGDAPAPGIGERARGQSARGRPIEVVRRREALLSEEPVSSGSVSSAPSLRRRLFIPAIACSLLLAAWALPQLSSPGGEESRRGEDPAPISALPSATPDRAESGTARPPTPRADPEAAGSVARVETPPTLLGRWLLLEPGVLEDAWSVSILLLGRAPSPGEVQRFADGGLDEFLLLARRSPEHWRHRARGTLGREELPAELLPAEAPRDLARWGDRLRRLRAEVGEDQRGGWPLPEEDGSDTRYTAAVRARLEEGAIEITDARGALRSLWTAGAGRPLTAQVEDALERIVDRGIPPAVLVRLLAPWISRYHPILEDPATHSLKPSDWLRLVPAGLADGEAGVPGEGLEAQGSLTPAGHWARLLLARLPALPTPSPIGGPPGRLSIELHAPFDPADLLREPGRIPRLWDRLSHAHLRIGGVEDGAISDPLGGGSGRRPGETLILLSEAGSELPLEGEVRTADGFLLPEIGLLAELLKEPHQREIPALPPEDLADPRFDDLLASAGQRLAPGAGATSAYRPLTRGLLIAGAQLGAQPGKDVLLRARLTEAPREEEVGEWVEWISALELVTRRRPSHEVLLLLRGPVAGGGSREISIEWGPQTRAGWVEHLDRLPPGDAGEMTPASLRRERDE